MGIASINSKKTFILDEAQELLPVIWKITDSANAKFMRLTHRLESVRDTSPEMATQIDKEIEDLVTSWKMKLRKLGVSPKGLWLADFDNGSGYYCWKFPERQITHTHGYQDGFLGRRLIRNLKEVRE